MAFNLSPTLSVVIPVYNEALNIEETLRKLQEYLPLDHEVLIIYDFDEDSTLSAVRTLMPNYPSVQLVKNHIARGASGALRTGFEKARADRVLVVMADLCDDFSQIPSLLDIVPAQADVACPSRYCPGGAQMLKPSLKVWAPKTAGWLLRKVTGIPTLDPTNSFKLYSASMLHALRLTSTVSFSVTLEIIAKAHCLGYQIMEMPTVWHDRQHGKTNFKLGRSLAAYLPWFCVAILRNRFLPIPTSLLRRFLENASSKTGRMTVSNV